MKKDINMEKILRLYNELIEGAKPKISSNHGIQVLHQGVNVDESSILFVGRENNGHGHKIDDIKKPINNFITEEFNWLCDIYKYTKSPFWRVVGKVTSEISNEPYNVNIYKKIYWTNIYKISPSEKKPNTQKTKNFQFEKCKELLLEEIRFLKPKAIIFLTDYWVNGFINSWESKNYIYNRESESVGYFNNKFQFRIENNTIPVIVLPHPQNKRSGASERDLINYIKASL